MGWGSAGGLFDDIVESMVEAGVSGDKLTEICVKMIRQFQDGDWDTEDESLEHFENDADVVAAFRQCGIHPHGREELAAYILDFIPGVSDREKAEALADVFLPALRKSVVMPDIPSHVRVSVVVLP